MGWEKIYHISLKVKEIEGITQAIYYLHDNSCLTFMEAIQIFSHHRKISETEYLALELARL